MRASKLIIALVFATASPMFAISQGPSVDQQMVDGLLARRLFSLAERYCVEHLAQADVKPRRMAELAVELSRVHAEQALHLPPAERAEAWQKAETVIDDHRQRIGGGPYSILLDRQSALIALARGELARHEAEVVARPEQLLATARKYLRSAISQLRALDENVSEQLVRRAQRQPDDSDQLTDSELRIFQNDVRYQLARSLLGQALSYPDGSPDRTNSLNLAAQRFRSLAEITDPMDWQSRLGLLTTLRRLKNETAWRQLYEQYMSEAPTVIEPLLELEKANLLLDRGNAAAALAALDEQRPLPTIAARWDFARLQALLDSARQAGATSDAQVWQKKAIALVEQIERQHGGYWMRRAEGLMGRQVATSPATGDLAILLRAAAGYYRAGKLQEAIATYDQAAQGAAAAGQAAGALEAGRAAAAIQQQRESYEDARDRFRRIAIQFAATPGAADSHLMAIYNEAERLRRAPARKITLYTELLNEHLEQWPDSKSANQAAWWLARLRISQRDWPAAVAALQQVDQSFARYKEVVDSLSQSYSRWLRQLNRDDVEYQTVARKAVETFSVLGGQVDADARPAIYRRAMLEAARFQLHHLREQHQQVEQLLIGALESQQDAPAQWRTAVRVLLVYAIAAQRDRLEDARRQLEEMAAATPRDLLLLVDGLADLLRENNDPLLARVQLYAVELVEKQRDALDENLHRRLDRAAAEAYAAAGRRAEARAAYEKVSKTYPDDPRIQVGYAQFLLDGSDEASLRAALEKWREVETKSPRGSERWFLSKYSQALAHERLGNCRQATRIIKLTQVLHPELGGPELKAQFLQLARRCESPAR